MRPHWYLVIGVTVLVSCVLLILPLGVVRRARELALRWRPGNSAVPQARLAAAMEILDSAAVMPSIYDRDWYVRRLTVANAIRVLGLARHGEGSGSSSIRPCRAWEELLDVVQVGDELWEYRSPPITWKNLAGRAGVALLRGGREVANILTAMNSRKDSYQ